MAFSSPSAKSIILACLNLLVSQGAPTETPGRDVEDSAEPDLSAILPKWPEIELFDVDGGELVPQPVLWNGDELNVPEADSPEEAAMSWPAWTPVPGTLLYHQAGLPPLWKLDTPPIMSPDTRADSPILQLIPWEECTVQGIYDEWVYGTQTQPPLGIILKDKRVKSLHENYPRFHEDAIARMAIYLYVVQAITGMDSHPRILERFKDQPFRARESYVCDLVGRRIARTGYTIFEYGMGLTRDPSSAVYDVLWRSKEKYERKSLPPVDEDSSTSSPGSHASGNS
ncbi:MAG: hypothetical protein SGCHY_000728 [Lobulomycetales sp.]